MNTPTRQAPHICDQVLFQISASCLPFPRSSNATMIHDARMAEPPTNGVQLKSAAIVAPWAIEDAAVTCRWSITIPGSLDHGPVQATTTIISTAIGSQAWKMSPPESPCPTAAEVPPANGLPP